LIKDAKLKGLTATLGGGGSGEATKVELTATPKSSIKGESSKRKLDTENIVVTKKLSLSLIHSLSEFRRF